MALSAKDTAAVRAAAKAGGLSVSQGNAIVAKANAARSSSSSSSAGSSASTPARTAVQLGNGATVYYDTQGNAYSAPTGGTPVSNSTVSAAKAGTQNTFGLTPTGDPVLDNSLSKFKQIIEQMGSAGQLPANMQITPEVTAKFLSWAHGVVDPQTQQLLSAKAADINGALTNLSTKYENSAAQMKQQFGTDLATEQNNAGNNGVAFSGQRALNEGNMAASTNRALSSLGADAAYQIGDTLRTGAAAVGAPNANRFQLPTLRSNQVSTAGGPRGSSSTGNALDFGYNPSTYTVGSIPDSQAKALADKQANYMDQYYTLASRNPTRSINDLLGGITNKPAGAY